MKVFLNKFTTTEYLTVTNQLATLTSWPPHTNTIITLPIAEPLIESENVTTTLEATFTSTFVLFTGNNLTQNEITAQTLASTSIPSLTQQRPPTASNRSGALEVPIWLILCYSVILLCAIVGNLLVISTLTQNRRMRTITNVFLLNLAISDILLGVLCMPVTLVGTLLRNFIFGEFFCKLIQFSQAASVAVSSWTLVAISCERYYAICHPLRSRRWQTRSHAYKIIGCIWCGSMLCMTPIALFSQLMPTSRQGYRKCRENWPSYALPYERPYNIFLDLVLLVLPLVILSVAYILITRTLYVGMRIEKAMIFGGRYSGKLNAEQTCTQTLQHKGDGINGGFGLGKATYLSATSSSTATLTSATSRSSRFKINLLLKRQAANRNGSALGFSRHHSQNKGNLDNNFQETDIFQQQQTQQKQYHHQMHNPRLYQQQNHCHNYHQDLLVLQDNDVQPEQHQQQNAFNKLCGDHVTRLCCGKRPASSLTTNSTGRRHLYCMRFAALKTLQDNESINGGNSFCSSDCCSSSSGYGGGVGIGSVGNSCGPAGCNSINSPMVGNLPSSSTMASSTATYRYQMQQQQQQCNHHHHLHARNYYMQQVSPDPYGTKSEGKKLFSSKRNLRASDSVLRRNNIAKNLESKKRVIKMLSALVLEFFICWTPLYVINTVAMYIGAAIYEYIDYKTISALQLLAYSSSCCNPITYCFMNANFRRAFLDTFKGMQWCGKRFQRKRATPQNTNLCLAGNSSIRGNSITVQTIIDSPRL